MTEWERDDRIIFAGEAPAAGTKKDEKNRKKCLTDAKASDRILLVADSNDVKRKNESTEKST